MRASDSTGQADTIAAQATPPGRGGIGIVRVSGADSAAIAHELVGRLPQPRHAQYVRFRDAEGATIDVGLALYFPGPNSFTGEDVLELHAHGGPVVLDMLLTRVLELGARPARAGEFSERAFLNDKIDLAQAEAIADLIDASSNQAAQAALRSLQGEFSRRVHALVERLIQLRLYIEAAIDFPEEEIDFLSDEHVTRQLTQLREQLDEVVLAAREGSALREGLSVVIAGRPNAGKSSLLNALAGHERAIVTDLPGTTRDALRELIHIDGMPLHIIDTAGLRDSPDRVEQEGVRRAWQEIERADRVLLVVDATRGEGGAERTLRAELPAAVPVSTVYNKIDLSADIARVEEIEGETRLFISAKCGEGLQLLREHLKRCAGLQTTGEGSYSARRRHLDALRRARDFITSGTRQLNRYRAGELLAEDLRQAQHALGEITGEFTSDDLLGRIFASFCIGK